MNDGLISRLLRIVERGGNALPHPATLFALFGLSIVLLSGVTSWLGVSVTHPSTGKVIEVVNLFSVSGLHRILTGLVENFTSFAPLGTVLVAMLGIGVAEASGLLETALRRLVLGAPKALLTPVIVFAGVMSNTAGEVGYVLLVPLAALLFRAAGRHPLAGLAAAFAGVSGGYSANLLLGTVDPLLAGLTQEAARILVPSYVVSPACNYYFLAASTFVITITGTLVTQRFIVPRLGAYESAEAIKPLETLKPEERRGLRFALLAAVGLTLVVLAGLIPSSGFLRDAKTGSVLTSPFLSGIVAFIFLGGLVLGLAYGFGSGRFKSERDVVKGMDEAMKTMAGYLVLVFFAAQFVAFFKWTNLGLIVAVKGAAALKALGLGGVPLLIGLVALSALLNLFMGSASAKWAVMAPAFVPMFMLLGYSPELTQAAYRVGDSVTNIISPMMTYFALIIAFVQRYSKDAGMGTLLSLMLPYSVVFFIVWTIFLVGWYLLGLPVGPGAPLLLPAGALQPG